VAISRPGAGRILKQPAAVRAAAWIEPPAMTPIRFFPEDSNQALRVRRYLIASGTTLLVVLLLCVCYWAGLMSLAVLAGGIAFALFRVVLFYVLFRTGINQRFRDPSLTTEQIVLATLNTALVMFFAEQARSALLPVYVIPFLFGVFRLRIKDFLMLGLVVLLIFGSMQFLSSHLGFAGSDHVRDLVEFAVVAVVVPWFAVFGGYVNGLRAELGAANRKLKGAFERIEQIAVHDELTGLYNRRFLLEVLRREHSRAKRLNSSFAVCMFDIDHFKSINDTLGHAAGDAVLKHFALISNSGLRGVDVLGRYGGEEFLLILPDAGRADACTAAERVRAVVEAAGFPQLPADRHVTVTIGVAASKRDETVETLLGRADGALYEGKAAGRNRVAAVG
jgi:diguanylate cyclase (GGDEF)-like protein